jgi:hypothetical protein
LQNVYEIYLDATMTAYQRTRQQEYLETAVAIAEHARARVLFESLSDLRGANMRGADPELLRRERELTASIRALGVKRASAPPGDAAEALDRDLEKALSDYALLQADIHRQTADYGSVMHPRPPSVDVLRGALAADTAVLEFALGDQRSWAWLITRTEIVAAELPKREVIETLGRTWYNKLRRRETAPNAEARELSRLLLEPFADRLAARRLAIVPSGILYYLPFAALAKTWVASGARVPLVGDEHEVVLLPSLATLATLRERSKDGCGSRGSSLSAARHASKSSCDAIAANAVSNLGGVTSNPRRRRHRARYVGAPPSVARSSGSRRSCVACRERPGVAGHRVRCLTQAGGQRDPEGLSHSALRNACFRRQHTSESLGSRALDGGALGHAC